MDVTNHVAVYAKAYSAGAGASLGIPVAEIVKRAVEYGLPGFMTPTVALAITAICVSLLAGSAAGVARNKEQTPS